MSHIDLSWYSSSTCIKVCTDSDLATHIINPDQEFKANQFQALIKMHNFYFLGQVTDGLALPIAYTISTAATEQQQKTTASKPLTRMFKITTGSLIMSREETTTPVVPDTNRT